MVTEGQNMPSFNEVMITIVGFAMLASGDLYVSTKMMKEKAGKNLKIGLISLTDLSAQLLGSGHSVKTKHTKTRGHASHT